MIALSPVRGWLAARLDDAHLACVFLTRLPLPHLRHPIPSLARSLWAFPLVGAGVGLIAGGVISAAHALGLPAPVAVVLAVCAAVLLTGALHEDGLADIADGFGGGATPERKREILRDSRVGSYGVVALILAFALRWAALVPLAEASSLTATVALMAAHALGRASVSWAMVLGRPARTDGLGASAGQASLGMAVISGLVAAAIVALGLAVLSPLLLPLTLPLCVLMLAVTVAVGWLAHRQIGGYTGDVLGAIVLLSECLILVACASALS